MCVKINYHKKSVTNFLIITQEKNSCIKKNYTGGGGDNTRKKRFNLSKFHYTIANYF